ncbi:MAG: hypothetical protein AAB393_10400, partial [Bacteroidota bacterium]
DWQERIAVQSRRHFQKDQVYIKDGTYDIKAYWTEDGLNSEMSNVTDETGMVSGVDYGGAGKGTFHYTDSTKTKIVFGGWPVNYDENNLLVLTGLGAFVGKGNTAPSYIKADAATGVGKPLYFAFHGCLVAGTPDETQGCYEYHLDNATMPNDPDTLVIDEYVRKGLLPDGYVKDPADCSALVDPAFAADYSTMACINYKIMAIDRDHLTNYYESNRFTYENNDYYNGTTCGQGM